MKRKIPMRKGKRVTKPASLMPETTPTSVEEFEKWIVQQAAYFTAVRKQGPGRVQRKEYPTLKKAIMEAKKHPRTMVYAVNEFGRSAMIGPNQYDAMLALRGEK